MVAISQVLDNQLVLLVGGLITLVGSANIFLLRAIKRDTTQVNNAVNHVEPGKKPLTQRVDRVEETLVVMQYEQGLAKTAAIEAKKTVESLAASVDETQTMIEKLMTSHVHTNEKIDDLIDKMPKRKSDIPDL